MNEAETQEAKRRARDFLEQKRMNPGQVNLDETVGLYIEEMRRGLAGEQSSLQMLPTFIEVEEEVPQNKQVIVLDAGGTNFRVATIWFDEEGKPHIENFQLRDMPGVKGEVGKKEFFEIMADYVEPVIEQADNIGFCFSYPTEMQPNKDGKLTYFSKEIQAKEVIGEVVGEGLLRVLRDRGRKEKKRIVILNDTVATLLAGRSAFGLRSFDSYIGFILGTGSNASYIENNSCIGKLKDLDPRRQQVINIESGNFSKAPRGEVDRLFDSTTSNPGRYTFEKMYSGAYFGPLFLHVLKQAAEDGLFSGATVQGIAGVQSLSTRDIGTVLTRPLSSDNPLSFFFQGKRRSDAFVLFYLIDDLLDRSARLAASALSAIVLQSQRGGDPYRPVCINADGSVFYGLKFLRERIVIAMQRYLSERKRRFFEIIKVENAPLIGAAIAGLTN